MAIDVSKLPPAAQEQVYRKLSADVGKKRAKPNKLHAVKTTVNGITFDSKKEARRYAELMELLRAGVISDLRLQPEITLQGAYKTAQGEPVRAIRYRADFSYTRDGKTVWEDVKGMRTDVYRMKRKMCLDKGIEIVEV